ncbi:MAG TPA: ATP-binding cassette domain-containing protein [Desulfomonilaceae bacterium]|nr:ATP-binding cassette domain-containing protein [Desulfomonilaceae bacterium]
MRFHDVRFCIGRSVILTDLNWALADGENWAVQGPNAAGKSTFLKLVRGDLHPCPGIGKRIFFIEGSPTESPLRFRRQTGLVSSELLDRYRTEGWNVSGLEAVCTGFDGTYLLQGKPGALQRARAREIMTFFGLEELADRSILSMSMGQAKRILIARALVHNPRFLFLDEACAGLDASSRSAVLDTIQKAAESGVNILYSSHNLDDCPPALNRFLKLESGRIVEQGGRHNTATRKASGQSPFVRFRPGETRATEQPHNGFLIRVENAAVSLNGATVIKEVDWTLRPGENWAVLGPNGSGKTTFLKLLAGELLPVWGGTVRRLGHRRRTLWDIRQLVSFVSGDHQSSFQCGQTGLELVLSGFFGSIGLHEKPTPSQIAVARSWMNLFGLGESSDTDVRTLSYGRLRLLLIVRAMVTDPAVLLLDEPVVGLDTDAKAVVLHSIDKLAGRGTGIVYVTHHENELVNTLTHVALMHEGRFAFQGTRREFEERHFHRVRDISS